MTITSRFTARRLHQASLALLTTVLIPATAMATTTLRVQVGTGEFQHLDTSIAVERPQDLTFFWNSDKATATGGTWQVTTASANSRVPLVVASGEAVRGANYWSTFTIPSWTFLKPQTGTTSQTFSVRFVPHDAAMTSVDAWSANVAVHENPPASGIQFGDNGVYGRVEIVSAKETIQYNYAGMDLTVKVSNPSATATLASWLSLKDSHVLWRQNAPKVSVPVLAPGASMNFTIHLDPVLPPPKSQLGYEQQIADWKLMYDDACGGMLASLLEYAGPLAQAPMNTLVQAPLVKQGWTDYAMAAASQAETVCDGKDCVNLCKLQKSVRKRLDGHVVGYSLFTGPYPRFLPGGLARTKADAGVDVPWASDTKTSVGSVSKFVTAVTTLAVLDKYKVDVGSSIGTYLPSDWSNAPAYIKNLSFAQLLNQTTGIKDYGNVSMTYAQLKSFYTQSLNASASTACPSGANATAPITVDPINPNNTGYCYSNYNFGILRILLPKVAGYAEAPVGTRPQTLADQFQTLARQNVFDRVGQPNVSCGAPTANPGAQTFAYAHAFPGTNMGKNFGDESLVCGAASWWLSAEDLGKVLLSLDKRDGKILATSPDRFTEMRQRRFGLDIANNGEMEKNGAWGNGGNLVTTSVAVFGPVSGPRVPALLFLNSDIVGGLNDAATTKSIAQQVLEQAYAAARYTLP